MRILYVTDGGPGGISSHVRCLTQCLKGVADVYVCITQKTDALQRMLDEDDTPYHLCNCSSGHDWRLFVEMRHVVRSFKPDVIHLHDYRLFGALYLRFFTKIPRVCSIHLPSNPDPDFSRMVVNWAVQPCYWLPVSKNNWERFSAYHPGVRGEVFFNPIRIEEVKVRGEGEQRMEGRFIVGMVGRNATVKDWPAFCKVARKVAEKALTDCRIDRLTDCREGSEHSINQSLGQSGNDIGQFRIEFWGVGVSESEAKGFGEDAKYVEWKGLQPNGREWIAKMDLLLLTSVSEEMPTVVLEAFQMRTPVCGFVPKGGMANILSFSNGALREVFLEERDCNKLSKIVTRLKEDTVLREQVIEDGWQILVNHFDAEKNCRGRLMEIYREQIAIGGR